MDEFSYKTIAAPVHEILLKEKGSKFIGYAFPVGNEAELKEHLEQIRNLHPKATHHCYAFRLGKEGENYRANDDGEPSGSAGLPIYNQILAHELTNILLIVVRYYGGTKLGVAGLIKAYKETAKETLAHGEVIIQEEKFLLQMSCGYDRQSSVYNLINRFSGTIVSSEQKENAVTTVAFRKAQKKDISELIPEMPDINFEFL